MKTAPGEILALARIIEELDYYQLLDVRRDAGAGEVKRAYHARSRNFHPDANRHLDGALRAASARRREQRRAGRPAPRPAPRRSAPSAPGSPRGAR